MSNVLFRCPEEGCNGRLFAEPRPGGVGSKSKIHCPHHTDTLFEQVEQYGGPNFKLINPSQGVDEKQGQTHIQTGGVQKIKTVQKQVKVEEPPEVVRDRLEQRYRYLCYEEPDKRWSIKTLRNKVKVKEEELETATKAEFEAKKKAAGEDED